MIPALILVFLQIGLLGFGGGYAILPLIRNLCVDVHGWLSPDEFINLVTISQLTPGPILLASATFIGNKVAGIPGAVLAISTSVTPSMVIVSALSGVYYKHRQLKLVQNIFSFLKPVIIGLIGAACLTNLKLVLLGDSSDISNLNIYALVLIIVVLIALRKTKINPLVLMVLVGIFSVLCYLLGLNF